MWFLACFIAIAILQDKQFVSSRLRPYVISDTDHEHSTAGFRSKERSPFSPKEGHASRVHEVAFYRDDASFVGGFTRFVEAAPKAGKPVIVIATEAHRSSILDRLQAHGWDIATVIREGIYISLDASDILSTFMVNDWPDSVQLSKVVGNLIAEAAGAANGGARQSRGGNSARTPLGRYRQKP
jgi:hypothetical protein